MADLLLELFSEEIPARMQEQALDALFINLASMFDCEVFPFKDHKKFVTPRRLALLVKNLPTEVPFTEEEIKGPRVGAPESALEGFLKKNNLTFSSLTERDGTYFAIVRKGGQKTSDLLKLLIEDLLPRFPWPKSMRWGSGETAWVRPLHSILCIFGNKVVPVSFAGLVASNTTRGHRFLCPDVLTIANPGDYEAALEKAYVIADREKRKARILEQAENAAAQLGLRLKKDDGLLGEVTGLVEWPVVLAGRIDANYMDLPKEVLVSEMRAHQKYFALENADGTLSDRFLITANMETSDGGKAIIAGNERVLRARLADGRFFWDQDRKKTLEAWVEGLKSVTYHAKLGSIADKVERIKALALQLAEFVSGADKKHVERAAALCKADLVTGMVGEFPELQGVMGRYYALHQGEKPEVADAIRDHYKPQGPGDAVPMQPVAVCVALADKLDTLIAMFAIGEKPTGSKDPFALRRAALGIIRIVLENNIRLPLKTLFVHAPLKDIALHKAHEKLIQKTEARLHEPHKVGKYLAVHETACEDIPEDAQASLVRALLEFFIDRLKVQLKESGLRHDVINAVVADGDDDLVRIVARAQALQEFLGTEDGANLLVAYRRAANILGIEEKKDKAIYAAAGLEMGALKAPEEIALAELLTAQTGIIDNLRGKERFTDAMRQLSGLRSTIDAFFDKIMVNCDDKDLRVNRLRLLAKIRSGMDGIARFSLIEG